MHYQRSNFTPHQNMLSYAASLLAILLLISNTVAAASSEDAASKVTNKISATKISATKNWGAAFPETTSVPLAKAVTDYKKDSDLCVSATVHKRCQKKGCWMILKDGPVEARVTFADYSFFVPFSIENKKVVVKGKIERKQLSVEEARHYLQDEGKSPEEIAAVTSPLYEYSMVATGVRLSGTE